MKDESMPLPPGEGVQLHMPQWIVDPRPEALLEGLMRIQDKVRGMKDLTKNQPIQMPLPSRTGYVLLPEEISTPEKADAWAKKNKELATPAKA
jgi:NADH-quinone oxidoreductase subunit B